MIDFGHSDKLENASLALIQEISAYIETKIEHVKISLNQGQEKNRKIRQKSKMVSL
jgi:hypothetical protein